MRELEFTKYNNTMSHSHISIHHPKTLILYTKSRQNSLGRIMIMLPRNIPPCTPLLGFGGFGNLIVLFGSFFFGVCVHRNIRMSA